MKLREKGNRRQLMQRNAMESKAKEPFPFSRTTLYCCMVAALGSGLPLAALAAPQGGEVVGGSGTISSSGTTTTVQQQTSSLAINWQTFNVASGETVQFVQPSASSVVLNRILDQNPSQIFGSIQANGRVFLSNPNGIVFGETATVNVGSLVASGLDISVDDFMQGRYTFGTAGTEGGAVINHGLITAATGGSVTLVGSSVSNTGVIVANYGTVNMGAGQTAVLDFDGDGLLSFQVDGAVLSNALGVTSAVDNQGRISALGGQVLLTGAAAQDVFSRVVNNDGIIEAGRIDNTGGVVRLVGVGPGEVINSGTIDVSGQDAVSAGGTVQLLGQDVGLFGSAVVNASGSAGGGTVLIGGDTQGSNPAIPNATAVYVSPDAVVNADALLNGDGGKVVVFAQDATRMYGSISARGGAEGGNGGTVETSGHYLDVEGTVDVSAPAGMGGQWLLDPYDLDICSGSTCPTAVVGTTFSSDSSTSQLNVNSIQNALGNNVTVTVQTGAGGSGTGTITWDSGATLDYSGKGNTTLNLIADGDIQFSGTIKDAHPNIADNLTLNLTAGGNIHVGTTSASGSIDTQGGTLTTQGVNFDSTNGTITTAGGNVTFSNTGAITLGGIDTSVTSGTGGKITIGTAPSASGSIVGTPSPTTIDGGTLTANEIDLYATGGIGTTTHVGTTATYVNAQSDTGNIYIDNSGNGNNVTFGGVNGGASSGVYSGVNALVGDIFLTNTNGSLTVGQGGVAATGTTSSVTLTTIKSGGSTSPLDIILDGVTSATTAVTVTSAGTIIGSLPNDVIISDAAHLDAQTGIGALGASPAPVYLQSFSSTNPMLVDATTANGDINLSNTGTLTVTSAGLSATNGNISLASTGDLLTAGGVPISATTLNLTAGGDIGTSASKPFYITGSAPAFGTVSGTNVYLQTYKDLTLGSQTTASNELYLASTAGNINNSGTSAAVSATNIDLTAANSINLSLNNPNGINLGTVTSFNGNITVSNNSGDLAVGTAVTATGNTVNLTSSGSINGNGLITANTLNLSAVSGIYSSTSTDIYSNTIYNPLNTNTSTLSVINSTSGAADIANSGSGLLTVSSISTYTGGVIDIFTQGQFSVNSISGSGQPLLTLGTASSTNLDWNPTGVYRSGETTPFISDAYLSGLNGLTLKTMGNISVEGLGTTFVFPTGTSYPSPVIDVGLVAGDETNPLSNSTITFGNQFNYYYQDPTLGWRWGTFSAPASTFNSLSAASTGQINVNSTLTTKVGDISLDSTNAGLTVSNPSSMQTQLVSAKGITLAAASPMYINGNFTLDTSKNGGNIDLGLLDIEESPSNSSAFYSMSVKSGSGDITLGKIGVTNALASVYTENSGTVYLDGDITVKGTGNVIDLGNSGQIVIGKDVTMTTTNGGDINLGWNSKATTPTSTPIYSIWNPSGPYSLTINDPTGSVLLGPVGQAAPVNLSLALLQAWGPLYDLTVNNASTAVLYGNVTTKDKIDLGSVGLTQLGGNVGLVSTNVMLGPVNGQNYGLSVTASGTTTLSGSIVTGGNLDLSGANTIDLVNAAISGTGVQPISLTSNNGSILLNGKVNDTSTNGYALTLAAQTGGVQLMGDVAIKAGGVVFDKTPITGSGALSITSQGNIGLYTVGNSTSRVKSLTLTDTVGSTTLNGDIYARDGVYLPGAIINLNSDVVFDTVDSPVNLANANVDNSHDVTVNSGTGTITLGNFGQTTPIHALTVNTTGETHLDGNIFATGSINLHNAPAVIIDNSITLKNADILLDGGTVDGPGGLDVYTYSYNTSTKTFADTSPYGTATFGQIGNTTPLDHLYVNGNGLTTFAGNISTVNYLDLSSASNVAFNGNAVIKTNTADLSGTINGAGAIDLSQVATINLFASSKNSDVTITAGGNLITSGTVNDVSAGNVTLTSNGGSVLLGDIEAGTNNVNVNAKGDILNNRGISDPANPLINITANSIALNAGSRIGVSTTDPIVVYVPGSITLSFGSDYAYIRNLLDAPVYDLGSGVVIDVMRNSLLSSEQNIAMWEDNDARDSTQDDPDEKDKVENKVTRTVTWLDNTHSPDVPRMIRTPKSWVFTRNNEYIVPAADTLIEKPSNNNSKNKWRKEGFRY